MFQRRLAAVTCSLWVTACCTGTQGRCRGASSLNHTRWPRRSRGERELIPLSWIKNVSDFSYMLFRDASIHCFWVWICFQHIYFLIITDDLHIKGCLLRLMLLLKSKTKKKKWTSRLSNPSNPPKNWIGAISNAFACLTYAVGQCQVWKSSCCRYKEDVDALLSHCFGKKKVSREFKWFLKIIYISSLITSFKVCLKITFISLCRG